jgi:hypothetical protein
MQKVVYQTNHYGLFLYETVANELALEPGSFNIPYGAHESAPPPTEAGTVARWDDDAWTVVEDHRGDALFVKSSGTPYELGSEATVNGEAVSYPGWGPVPGWLTSGDA